MKAIKFFSVAIAMAFAMSANAQFVSSGGGSKGSSRFSSAELDPKAHFMADVRLGSVASAGGFGFNFSGTKEITTFSGYTLAWDFLNVEFAAPFNSPANTDFLSLKTGLRLFSPSFMNDKLRLYTNLAVGYTCVLTKGASSSPEYSFLKKLIEFDWNDDKVEKWAAQQGYDEAEIKDIFDHLGNLEDDFEDAHDDSEFANDEEWDQAFLNSIGGSSKMQANHGFGLTWGFGVQIKKKFNIGYTLQYETAFKTKNHFATIGITF